MRTHDRHSTPSTRSHLVKAGASRQGGRCWVREGCQPAGRAESTPAMPPASASTASRAVQRAPAARCVVPAAAGCRRRRPGSAAARQPCCCCCCCVTVHPSLAAIHIIECELIQSTIWHLCAGRGGRAGGGCGPSRHQRSRARARHPPCGRCLPLTTRKQWPHGIARAPATARASQCRAAAPAQAAPQAAAHPSPPRPAWCRCNIAAHQHSSSSSSKRRQRAVQQASPTGRARRPAAAPAPAAAPTARLAAAAAAPPLCSTASACPPAARPRRLPGAPPPRPPPSSAV